MKKAIIKSFALLLIMVMAFTTLSACGNAASNTGAAAPGGQSTSTGGTDGESATAGKDSVVIATQGEPTAFFCQDQEFTTSQNKDGPVLLQIYDTLYWMEEDGSWSPSLATEHEVSDDGLEYTFTLRDDVYFHNGEKMTAEDVAFTYNLCVEKNATLTTNLLINFKEAQVVDETHVKMILTDPFPAFISETTSRVGFIICKSYYDEVGSAGYNEAPIGTGAYKFVSRISGSEIKLEANEEYWNGAPAIKSITIKPISESSTQFISLESGDIDVVINPSTAACIQLQDNSIATWASIASASRTTMTFYTAQESISPLMYNDKNLRHAIQSAINREDLITSVLVGGGTILDMDCVPTYLGAPAEGTYTPAVYDLEKAKEYLADSNYNGESLKLVVLQSNEKDAQIIQGQLMAIGINVEVIPCDTATFYGYLMGSIPYDMSIMTTTSSLNDATSLNTQYHTNELMPDAKLGRWEDLDRLCDEAGMELDPDKRQAMYAELISIVNEEVYCAPLYNSMSNIAYNKGLAGVVPHPQGAFRVWEWNW